MWFSESVLPNSEITVLMQKSYDSDDEVENNKI